MDNPDVHSTIFMIKACVSRTDWDGALSKIYALMKLLGIEDIPNTDFSEKNGEYPDTDSFESDEY